MIQAQVVADSLNPQGDRITSMLVTMPRIILAEFNTHRMFSHNTSSSRAIPFNKMVESIKENPFIPIAWQKEHKGMQGSEYLDNQDSFECTQRWLIARDNAIKEADYLSGYRATKQLCNRLLESFMWTRVLVTSTEWENFFALRCPQYSINSQIHRSWKDLVNSVADSEVTREVAESSDIITRLKHNKGQAEIHMMALAEAVYDALNESTPRKLEAGEWHIPFVDKIDVTSTKADCFKYVDRALTDNELQLAKIKISTAMCARTSYTVVGEEKSIDYSKLIELHDRLISQVPIHASPMEHCARAMSNEEYIEYVKGTRTTNTNQSWKDNPSNGWCRNFKGFIQYRHLLESNQEL
jgi:thymidylate synthase ThyX